MFAALLSSLTLLALADDRNQISSLVFAVCPGLLPSLFVIPHDDFVALCKHDEFAACVRITTEGIVDNHCPSELGQKCRNTFYQHRFKYI